MGGRVYMVISGVLGYLGLEELETHSNSVEFVVSQETTRYSLQRNNMFTFLLEN